ncbi:TonB-dependent receptor plug domain-containing protein, partial [Winslowiella iniecta]
MKQKQCATGSVGKGMSQKTTLALLVSVTLSGPVFAAEQTMTVNAVASDEGVTEDTGAYNTTTMVTGTGLSLSARETPQSVSVVTKQRMIDQNLDNAASVVNNTTGMFVRQLDADRFSFSSRGMGVNNILR